MARDLRPADTKHASHSASSRWSGRCTAIRQNRGEACHGLHPLPTKGAGPACCIGRVPTTRRQFAGPRLAARIAALARVPVTRTIQEKSLRLHARGSHHFPFETPALGPVRAVPAGRRCCWSPWRWAGRRAMRLLLDPVWGTRLPVPAVFPGGADLRDRRGLALRRAGHGRRGRLILAVTIAPATGYSLLVALIVFLVANAGMIVLADSARRARARAEHEAALAHESEQRFEVMADSAPLHDLGARRGGPHRVRESRLGRVLWRDRRRKFAAATGKHSCIRRTRSGYVGAFARGLQPRATVQGQGSRAACGRHLALGGIHRRCRASARATAAAVVCRHQPGRHRARRLEREREVLLESERAARTEAENATRAKDDFLATLSHELRTPLSVILLWSRILARKYGAANDDLHKGLALIADNGTALSRLIADLLDMSRIVSGRVLLDTRPVDVVEIVDAGRRSHRPAADGKRITLSLDIATDPAIVLGDATRLQQVLWNLLSNAIKFTPEHGHIWVTAGKAGESFLRGGPRRRRRYQPGVPAAGVQSFPPGRQFQRRGASADSAWASPSSSNSSTCTAARDGARAAARGTAQRSAWSCRSTRGRCQGRRSSGTWRRLDPEIDLPRRLEGMRVLAVEDQPDMLESLRRMLEDQGATVTAVPTGRVAFDLLRERPRDFDVLRQRHRHAAHGRLRADPQGAWRTGPERRAVTGRRDHCVCPRRRSRCAPCGRGSRPTWSSRTRSRTC